MFDRILSSVSIGSAEVDTRLDRTRLQPGEPFTAQVVVDGGSADQEIGELQLALQADIDEPSDDGPDTRTIHTWTVSDGFTIEEGEREVLEVKGQVPHETPVTEVDAPTGADVWVATDLDIKRAVDAEDVDYLQVEPTPAMRTTLRALRDAGYRLEAVETDPDRIQAGNVTANLALDQEFEFRPRASVPDRVEGAELHFLPREGRTHVRLEFECDGRSDRTSVFTVDEDDDPDAVAARVRDQFDGGVSSSRPTTYVGRFDEDGLSRYHVSGSTASLASERAVRGSRSVRLRTGDGSVDVGTTEHPVPENGDTFQYRFYPTPVEGDGGANVVFAAQPSGGGYRVVCNFWKEYFGLVRDDGDDGVTLDRTDVEFVGDTWYSVEVTWDGRRIAATLGDDLGNIATVAAEDGTYDGGGFELSAWANSYELDVFYDGIGIL